MKGVRLYAFEILCILVNIFLFKYYINVFKVYHKSMIINSVF